MAGTEGVWLTVDEAAARARVSEWTIYQACVRGELRHIRIGGRRAIRLTREALDEWLLRFERAPLAPEVDEWLNPRPPVGLNAKPGQGDGHV
jgi:excisionase family DNA binding protein